MLESLGQSIALATHANAALAGERVSLDIASNPWFKGMGSLPFFTGDGANKLGDNPDEWIAKLSAQGFTSAFLWFEPYDGNPETINGLAFIGGTRWAPVTAAVGVEIVWHERIDEGRDAQPEHRRLGFRVLPEQSSVQAAPVEAIEHLNRALGAMAAFQKRHFPEEPFTERMLQPAQEILRGAASIPDVVFSLFPGGYPETSYRLAGAVHAGWVLGGMGWWTDRTMSEPELESEFWAVTGDYYAALGKALFATCHVKL
ncbi:MAG: hypothetical protein ACAH95_14160 [Fimbriimonas sp.]